MAPPAVNYIIASYAGAEIRYSLELHLQSLFVYASCDPKVYLKRVVVVTPSVPEEDTLGLPGYYAHDKWVRAFARVGVEYMPVPYVGKNEHASYDQWLQGWLAIRGLDKEEYYCVFAEDDYALDPSSGGDAFLKLVQHYRAQCADVYMCTYAAQTEHKYHAVISNGIVSGSTLERLDRYCVDVMNVSGVLEHYYECAQACGVPQIGFSDLFLTCGIPVVSMHRDFDALFWSSFRMRVERYSAPEPVLPQFLVPIQYLTSRPAYDVVDRHGHQQVMRTSQRNV